MLPVPAAGVGLAGALELGGARLSDSQWHAANRCRIEPAGLGWQLINDSRALVCSVNGERVMLSSCVAIGCGDAIEVNLLCFEVEADQAAEPAVVAPLVDHHPELVPVPPAPAPASEAEPAAVDFDLRELAAFAAPEGAHLVGASLEDPFGVLDIAGAPARPAADTLAELLEEAEAPARAARVERTPDLAQAPGDAPGQASEGPAGALFDELHEEYVRTVRDPSQLSGRADWAANAAIDAEPAPTLDELSQRAEPYPLLRDILQPREVIDETLKDFEPLQRSTLFDFAEADDVLRLFAPEIVRRAKDALPSVTRRDHHTLSPDSHIDLGVPIADPIADPKENQ